MTDEIWRWDATRMAGAIARREISSREAVSSCLGRMAAVNPRLNAVTVDLGAGRGAAADRADAAVARGDALGALHGVPVTIKENIDQAGCATTNGVVAFRNLIAQEDSPVVANWTAAGAVIVGRTNTPAFSFRLDTENDLRGRTWNPWSEQHTPGGSSGGAAASVAAGITPLAHGNDIAGSIRYPAYACGLAGLRPSFGRVPAFNPSGGGERSMSSQLMSVQGPIGPQRARRSPGPGEHGGLRSARPLVGPGASRRRTHRRTASRWRWSPIRSTWAALPCTRPLPMPCAARPAGWPMPATRSSMRGRLASRAPMELWTAMQMPEIRVAVRSRGSGVRGRGHQARDGAVDGGSPGRGRRRLHEGAGGTGARDPRVAVLSGSRAAGPGAGQH